MINWDELLINILVSVVISSVISFLIAWYFRFKVKPKIEEIYEYNREFRIHNISSILEFSDWNVDELFDILEQNDCIGAEFLPVILPPNVLEKIQERVYRLKLAYNDVYERIAEAKQYVAGDELLLFLDFINFSMVFAEELSAGKYNPQYLRRRGITAKKLIKHFKEFFSEDFVKKWEYIEDSRLE